MNGKRWFLIFITCSVFIVFLFAGATLYVDPYIHYKLPDQKFTYILNRANQRYVNDGITRLFDYDAIITGTSMTECFKTTDFDRMFNVHSIKVPYAGAVYDEVTDNLNVAFNSGHNVKIILRSLDFYALTKTYQNNYAKPEYMYDDNLLNDHKYWFGRRAVAYSLLSLVRAILGNPGGITSFDDYCNWSDSCIYGKNVLLKGRKAFERGKAREVELSPEDKEVLVNNIQTNLIDIAHKHPETTFYYFLPPFSIVKWGEVYEAGEITKTIEEQKIAVKLLQSVSNIKVFAFDDCFDITTNLDNYREKEHYGGWINSFMLDAMHEGQHRLNSQNTDAYFDNITSFYARYNYASLFDDYGDHAVLPRHNAHNVYGDHNKHCSHGGYRIASLNNNVLKAQIGTR